MSKPVNENMNSSQNSVNIALPQIKRATNLSIIVSADVGIPKNGAETELKFLKQNQIQFRLKNGIHD
jgi:hypothetical protein